MRRHVIGKIVKEVDCRRSRVDLLVLANTQEAGYRITMLVSSNVQKAVDQITASGMLIDGKSSESSVELFKCLTGDAIGNT